MNGKGTCLELRYSLRNFEKKKEDLFVCMNRREIDIETLLPKK